MFEQKVLRKISGLRRKEKRGIDIIAMIKPTWMTWERHVACMGNMGNEYKHGTKTYEKNLHLFASEQRILAGCSEKEKVGTFLSS